jgi:hypothetical protein
MLATTSRKQLIVYKYNKFACLTSLKCKKTLESVCFTKKLPVLIFIGDNTGNVSIIPIILLNYLLKLI